MRHGLPHCFVFCTHRPGIGVQLMTKQIKRRMNMTGIAFPILLSFVQPAVAWQALREGRYICENSALEPVSLTVKQHSSKPHKLVIAWAEHKHILHNEPTTTGALRYEGAISQLVYLQVPSKSVVLDNKSMRPILNDCAWIGNPEPQTSRRSERSITMNGGIK